MKEVFTLFLKNVIFYAIFFIGIPSMINIFVDLISDVNLINKIVFILICLLGCLVFLMFFSTFIVNDFLSNLRYDIQKKLEALGFFSIFAGILVVWICMCLVISRDGCLNFDYIFKGITSMY